MADGKCPIWETPATVQQFPSSTTVLSDRMGGEYAIDRSARGLMSAVRLDIDLKKKLTTWIHAQRRAGVEAPVVTSARIGEIKLLPLLRFSERIDGALGELTAISQHVGSWLSPMLPECLPKLLIASQSEGREELAGLLRVMQQMDLLQEHGTTSLVTVTAGGWQRIEELERRQGTGSQGFVAMWFNEAMTEAYLSGFGPGISDAGYEPLRIDNKEHSNKVDDEIVAEIRRSRFLVADFTCEPGKVRGGVYFEAGFALGLGIPVIWTARETSISDLHFDTRQYNHIAWKDPTDLRTKLSKRISALLGDGPKKIS